MEESPSNQLLEAIKKQYTHQPSDKVKKYINAFHTKSKRKETIRAKVEGNHGTYMVSIRLKGNQLTDACSCYIGKYGCHHTTALAYNYKADPSSFEAIKITKRSTVKDLKTLGDYLKGASLEELIDELKETKGITQAAFAKSIGMSSRHIGAVKTAENRNRQFKELGAIKLACLYVLERKKIKK